MHRPGHGGPAGDYQQWRDEAKNTQVIEVLLRHYAHRLARVGKDWVGPCPKCGGTDRFSVDVADNIWTCRKCPPLPWKTQDQCGGDSIDLVRHMEDCEFDDACERITGRPRPANGKVRELWTDLAVFYYRLPDGSAPYRVTKRRNPKGKKNYWQSTYSMAKGTWDNHGPAPGQQIPYRLPELLANSKKERPQRIIVAEGEKCVDALMELGFCSTSNMGGAGKWWDELNQYFVGRDVTMVCDNDNPGRSHGHKVCAALKPHVKSIKLLHIEDAWPCQAKQDIADFIELKAKEFGYVGEIGEPFKLLRESVVDLLDKAHEWTIGEVADQPPTGYTEQDIEPLYAAQNAGDLKYLAPQKEWQTIQKDPAGGQVYIPAPKLEPLRRADELVRRLAINAMPKDRQRLLGKKFADNIEGLARRDPAFVISGEDCDEDRSLLNTKGGAYDLNSGSIVPYGDRVFRKITAVAPVEGPMPLWMAFLDRIMGGNEAMISFLQRCAGYWITGSIEEQKLFFLYGTGSNGKTVFVSTIASIMASYAISAPIELMIQTRNERHETEKAWLMGARLVSMSEPNEGERWHERKLKELTGESTIAARFTMGNYFQFPLQCKFVVLGNHEPSFNDVDEAIRRRFVLVPFEVKIPEGERDLLLEQKLMAEWPAILAWMIEGARCWREAGLMVPGEVSHASEEYLEEQDNVGAWIADCCEVGGGYDDYSNDLYLSWKSWCELRGEWFGSEKTFIMRLKRRGFRPTPNKRRRGLIGIRRRFT